MFTRPMPSTQRLKELLSYSPETGELRWLKRLNDSKFNNRYAGTTAGTPNTFGHIQVIIDKRLYLAHRIIFKMMTGNDPPERMDHINCDPKDNRWANLRSASDSQNRMNTKARRDNKLGVKGVYARRGAKSTRYISTIGLNGHSKHIGVFNTIDEAIAARKAEAEKLHKSFARHY